MNTYTNRNGDESYISTGRSKAAHAAAATKYRQNAQDAYRFLKDVSAQLGITPSEFLTQANAQSVAAIVAAALADKENTDV